MYKEIKLFKDRAVNAALYVFHDPPPANNEKRLVRATIAAYLTDNGQLFVGSSVCSEAENFTRADGNKRAVSDALGKMISAYKFEAGITKRVAKPDSIIDISLPQKEINQRVQWECISYQLERFRAILADRSQKIIELQASVDELVLDYLGSVLRK